MKTEKLTLADCMKYPNAKINEYTSSKDNPNEYDNIFKYIYSCAEFDGANIQFTKQDDFNDYYISNCKLILRPQDSMTDEEKIKELEFFHPQKQGKGIGMNKLWRSHLRGYDYLRSINVDIDNFIQSGKAVAE